MATSQFLLVGLGDTARVGGNVRVLAVAGGEAEAVAKLDELDPSILGTVAVVEVKAHYERRPAVLNTPTEKPLFTNEKKS